MEKFTKGEWVVERHVGAVYVSSERGDVIAKKSTEYANKGFVNEVEANAHLIAAAPEMYELLSCILERFEPYDEASIEIKKVLAKARGE